MRYVAQVQTFQMHRVSTSGEDQLVRVEIFDAGHDADLRYQVTGTLEDGRGCSGNPAPTLQGAFLVHWNNLDRQSSH